MMLLPLDRSCYRSIFSVQIKALRRYKDTKVTLSTEPTAKIWGENILGKNLFLSQTWIFSCTFSCQIPTILYKFHFTKLSPHKILHQVRGKAGKRGWRVNRSGSPKTGLEWPHKDQKQKGSRGSESLGEMSPSTRVLWILLPCNSFVLRDNPHALSIKILH